MLIVDTCTLKLIFTPNLYLLLKLIVFLLNTTVTIHSHIELLLFNWALLYSTFVVGGHTSHTFNNIISQGPNIVNQL